MVDGCLRHLDLREIAFHLPAYSRGKLDKSLLVTVPPLFSDEIFWSAAWLLEHCSPGITLAPPYRKDSPVQEWDETDAYLATCDPADELADIIESLMTVAWEYVNRAVNRDCDLTRAAAQNYLSELRIFKAIEDFVSQLVDPVLSDYLMMCALLIYQYDFAIFSMERGKWDEAVPVLDDIAAIRADLAQRDVKGYSENWKTIDATRNAKERAEKRHAPINQKKDALLAEWDATHAEYDSRADFARIISAREKMKERTLYDWIAAHEKKKTSLSS